MIKKKKCALKSTFKRFSSVFKCLWTQKTRTQSYHALHNEYKLKERSALLLGAAAIAMMQPPRIHPPPTHVPRAGSSIVLYSALFSICCHVYGCMLMRRWFFTATGGDKREWGLVSIFTLLPASHLSPDLPQGATHTHTQNKLARSNTFPTVLL